MSNKPISRAQSTSQSFGRGNTRGRKIPGALFYGHHQKERPERYLLVACESPKAMLPLRQEIVCAVCLLDGSRRLFRNRGSASFSASPMRHRHQFFTDLRRQDRIDRDEGIPAITKAIIFPWPKGGLMPQGRSIPTSRDSTATGTRIESVMPAILLRGGVNFGVDRSGSIVAVGVGSKRIGARSFMGRSCLAVDGFQAMNVRLLKCAKPNMDAGVPAVRGVTPASMLPRDNQS